MILLGLSMVLFARAEEDVLVQEQPVPPNVFEKLDAVFGAYFVAPMASVLFYDLYCWDNQLPLGEGIGTTIGGMYVEGFSEGKYTLRPEFSVPVESIRIRFDQEREEKSAYVSWILSENAEHQIIAKFAQTEIVSLEVPFTPIEEWSVGKGALPTVAQSKGVVMENGSILATTKQYVTDALTDLNIPVIVELPIAPKEETEVLPPYTIPAQEVVVSDQQFSVEAGATVWVTTADQSPWKPATFVRTTKTMKTSFTETEAGFVKNTVEIEQAVLRGVDTQESENPLNNPRNVSLPAVVVWLVLGALYFTVRMGFISIRGFKHAIDVVMGKYDDAEQEGDVSHFQALSSALSATVGLGNIAGVAIAVSVGGPGAIFWMVIAGFLGMSSKFTECSLGQLYRSKDENGFTLGGPMRYLDVGLAEKNWGKLGKTLAVIFAVMCVGGSFGGGNMFQANQSYVAVANLLPLFQDPNWGAFLYGMILAILTGVVILGGIKSIGKVAEIIVPFMCGLYLLAGGYILLSNASLVADAFSVIWKEAWAMESAFGGLIGALVQGFRRAAFSNEAGVGSASIAHSAAATNEPISEGIVALLEPFIDTIVVCTMTGLVVVVTGAYLDTSLDGISMTTAAFGSVISWFPIVLSIAVFFFAFSTMISWSYYGERCAIYLFGAKASMPYKIVFLFFIVMGCTIKLGNVLDFSDLMILGMAFPNILGLFMLSGTVRAKLDEYWAKLQDGRLKPSK